MEEEVASTTNQRLAQANSKILEGNRKSSEGARLVAQGNSLLLEGYELSREGEEEVRGILSEREANLQKQVAKISNAFETSDIVELNVGRVRYTTSKLTLCKEPDSTLALMFKEGQIPLTLDKEGEVFIDRDGNSFRYILDYLRGNYTKIRFLSEEERQDLLVEADFFQLQGLIAKLKGEGDDCNIGGQGNSQRQRDLNWMDTSDAAQGFRQWKDFPRIFFAVANIRIQVKNLDWEYLKLEVPKGFHWCETEEFLREVKNSAQQTEFPYYAQAGWNGSTWNGNIRVVFLFADSKDTEKFKHGQSKIANSLHTFASYADSPLAGIICIKN